mmetsp:Transcript_35226/g.82243  ORF Transcript_35226/g.82243 Transcript_35226/m.82243 type:complete len:127 (+) Transcript_35226:268-648(+)
MSTTLSSLLQAGQPWLVTTQPAREACGHPSPRGGKMVCKEGICSCFSLSSSSTYSAGQLCEYIAIVGIGGAMLQAETAKPSTRVQVGLCDRCGHAGGGVTTCDLGGAECEGCLHDHGTLRCLQGES